MPMFRRKPVVVEAVQWTTEPSEDVKAFFRGTNWASDFDGGIFLDTPDGIRLIAKPGDWVIKDADGKMFPIKPDVFAENYDPISE